PRSGWPRRSGRVNPARCPPGCPGYRPQPGLSASHPRPPPAPSSLPEDLDFELDRDAVPDDDAAGLQNRTPGQAEVPALDFHTGAEAGRFHAVDVGAASVEMRLQDHR